MSKYEIRACRPYGAQESSVMALPLDAQRDWEPDWYGIYENLPDGTQEWVSDHDTLGEAFAAKVTLDLFGAEPVPQVAILHEFIPPYAKEWGDFCWAWNEDEGERCGHPAAEHITKEA